MRIILQFAAGTNTEIALCNVYGTPGTTSQRETRVKYEELLLDMCLLRNIS